MHGHSKSAAQAKKAAFSEAPADGASDGTASELRHYALLNSTIDADSDMNEYAFVPLEQLAAAVPPDGDEAPGAGVCVWLEEHKLAVNTHCVLALFRTALRTLHAAGECRATRHQASRTVLMINADNHAALNARKRLLLSPAGTSIREAVRRELKLLDLIFSVHPKSGEAWTHRRWVLLHASSAHAPTPPSHTTTVAALPAHPPAHSANDDLQDMLRVERATCTRSAVLYPCNYFAWTHRLWLFGLHSVWVDACPKGDQCASAARAAEDLRAECVAMSTWARTNISDHAGLHYRAAALELHMKASQRAPDPLSAPAEPAGAGTIATIVAAECDLWEDAWKQVNELQQRYPGHEVSPCARLLWKEPPRLAMTCAGASRSLVPLGRVCRAHNDSKRPRARSLCGTNGASSGTSASPTVPVGGAAWRLRWPRSVHSRKRGSGERSRRASASSGRGCTRWSSRQGTSALSKLTARRTRRGRRTSVTAYEKSGGW